MLRKQILLKKMIKDIYIRDEKDPHFIPGVIDYTNEVESVISQIRMILSTKPTEVFGDIVFGIDLEQIVYGTKRGAEEVSSQIRDLINRYVSHSPSTHIDVQISFGDSGEGYDYAVIDITINGIKAVGFLVAPDDENEQ